MDYGRSWAYRFHCGEKFWLRDPTVFVDMGRAMPGGSPALFKGRRRLHKDQAEEFWKQLVRMGRKRGQGALGRFC